MGRNCIELVESHQAHGLARPSPREETQQGLPNSQTPGMTVVQDPCEASMNRVEEESNIRLTLMRLTPGVMLGAVVSVAGDVSVVVEVG